MYLSPVCSENSKVLRMQSRQVVHLLWSLRPLPGSGFHGNTICTILRLSLFFFTSRKDLTLWTCSSSWKSRIFFFFTLALNFSLFSRYESQEAYNLAQTVCSLTHCKACLSLNTHHPFPSSRLGGFIQLALVIVFHSSEFFSLASLSLSAIYFGIIFACLSTIYLTNIFFLDLFFPF